MTTTGPFGNTIIKGKKTIHFTTKEGKSFTCSNVKYTYYGECYIPLGEEKVYYPSSLYIYAGYSARNCKEFENVTNVWEE